MLSLLIYMLICSFTPGPGNILALKTTTTYGWKKSHRLLLGICAGYATVQTICTICLYQLNIFFENILNFLSVLGGIYMIWLAYHIIKSKPDLQIEEKSPTFSSGLLLQLVNGKIYFYIMTLLSKYFIPWSEHPMDLIGYGIFAVSIGCMACVTWAGAGAMLQKYYEKYFAVINKILGALLLFCAINMLR